MVYVYLGIYILYNFNIYYSIYNILYIIVIYITYIERKNKEKEAKAYDFVRDLGNYMGGNGEMGRRNNYILLSREL